MFEQNILHEIAIGIVLLKFYTKYLTITLKLMTYRSYASGNFKSAESQW